MPKKCCLPNCKIQRDDPGGFNLSFYIFPADENVRKKWLDNIKKHFDIELKKYSYVCSRHFDKNCFESTSSTKNGRIKKESCPTIFLDFKNMKQPINNVLNSSGFIMNSSNSSTVTTDVVDDSTHYEDNVMESDFGTQEANISSNSVTFNVVSHEVVDMLEAESVNTLTDPNVKVYNANSCSKVNLPLPSSKEVHVSNKGDISPFIVHNVHERNDNSSKVNSLLPRNICKKSLANIDLSSVDFTIENLPILKSLLYNGQNEIIAMRQKMKSRRMKMYRYKKRVTDVKSLAAHMKYHKYLTDKVSNFLEVSTNVNLHKV